MRLNKWIAHQGIASRRAADRLIAEGRVRVNGGVIDQMGYQVDPERDTVEVDTDGMATRVYVVLNKPEGVTTQPVPTADDPRIVIDMVPIDGLFPIGRLDKATTGLILLTNDGTLATALNHPEAQVDKEYDVTLHHPIEDGALRHLERGVPLFGSKTRPARTRRLADNRFLLTLTEGRNRQVRRMCRKVGSHVAALSRVRIGHIHLQDLPQGEWRHLTPEEVAAFLPDAPPR